MSKVNPLQRVPGITVKQATEKKKPDQTASSHKPLKLDRVEISANARLVQRAEDLQRSASNNQVEDAHRVGKGWYQYGYNLPEADET